MDIICSVSHPYSLSVCTYGSRDATTLPYASWPITTSNSPKIFSPYVKHLRSTVGPLARCKSCLAGFFPYWGKKKINKKINKFAVQNIPSFIVLLNKLPVLRDAAVDYKSCRAPALISSPATTGMESVCGSKSSYCNHSLLSVGMKPALI